LRTAKVNLPNLLLTIYEKGWNKRWFSMFLKLEVSAKCEGGLKLTLKSKANEAVASDIAIEKGMWKKYSLLSPNIIPSK
jgi:hypothetical protein